MTSAPVLDLEGLPPELREAAARVAGRSDAETAALLAALARAAARARAEAEAGRARLEAVGEVGRAIRGADDLDRTLARLLELALRLAGGEVGAIVLAEDLGRMVPPRVSWGLDEEIPERLRGPDGRGLVAATIADGVPFLAPDLRAAGLDLSGLSRVPTSLGVFPLAFEGERLGALLVAQAPPEGLAAAAAAVGTVCSIAAAALLAARGAEERRRSERLVSEVALAREIQARLLPRDLPAIPGFTVAGVTEPAREVGGDYFDVFPLGAGRFGLVVADVSGKGVPASILMTGLRAYLRVRAADAASPADVVSTLNRRLAEDVAEDRFATLAYAVLDSATGAVEISSAGHLPPLVARAGRAGAGRVEEAVPSSAAGAPLGIDPDERYEVARLVLAPGDILLLHTDGVVETPVAGGLFGEARLRAALAAAHGDAGRALAQVRAEIWSAATGTPPDDLTLLVLARST